MASTLGLHNPLRYRGYVYDRETGLYYLQSRYYNPTWGRFVNADGLVATGQSILGCNMFTYCFNNPVNMTDSAGTWPTWNDIKEGYKKAVNWVNNHIVKPVKCFVKDVVEDIENYDTNNQSESVVFKSNYFSNYKGVFVIKTPFDASFSLGIIGLSMQQQDEATLKHEYGHCIQLDNMGFCNYIRNVAIPSVGINLLSRAGKLPYDYYGAPWEAEADTLGGVNRTSDNTPWPVGSYSLLWDIFKMLIN